MGDDAAIQLEEAEELITVLAAALHENILRSTGALRLVDAYRTRRAASSA